MNKVQITTSLILIGLVLGIFLYLQKDSLMSATKGSAIPTLPPDNMMFSTKSQQQSALQDPAQAQAQQALNDQTGAAPQAQQQAPQAQTRQAEPTMGVEEPVPATATAHLKTSKGTIDIKLDGTNAPNTVKNFISKAKSGFYTNLTFHRVEDWVVQGGDPLGNGTGGRHMATELNSTPFVRGSVGVARGSDINVSNDSQFFITKIDSPHLNNQYTNFGMVTKGLDVVDKIAIGDKILGITIENN